MALHLHLENCRSTCKLQILWIRPMTGTIAPLVLHGGSQNMSFTSNAIALIGLAHTCKYHIFRSSSLR